MIPELALGYAAGLIPTGALTGLHLYLYRRKSRSDQMRLLQRNLYQLGLFWSESEGRVEIWTEGSREAAEKRYRKSALWLGLICLFLSWLGFIIQLVVMTSLRYLAVSRFEQKIFSSDLVRKKMETLQIIELIEEYRQLDPRGFDSSKSTPQNPGTLT